MPSNSADKIFLFQYFHDNNWWIIEVWATNEEDAKERVKKMSGSTFLGQRAGVIPFGDDVPKLKLVK